MHELGIVFSIINSLEKVGEQNKLKSVSKVTLELGEVSTVIDTYLRDCWKWASDRSELLKGACLEIEQIPAVTICEDCGGTYATTAHGKTCPYCESVKTHLVSGNEIMIKEIAAC